MPLYFCTMVQKKSKWQKKRSNKGGRGPALKGMNVGRKLRFGRDWPWRTDRPPQYQASCSQYLQNLVVQKLLIWCTTRREKGVIWQQFDASRHWETDIVTLIVGKGYSGFPLLCRCHFFLAHALPNHSFAVRDHWSHACPGRNSTSAAQRQSPRRNSTSHGFKRLTNNWQCMRLQHEYTNCWQRPWTHFAEKLLLRYLQTICKIVWFLCHTCSCARDWQSTVELQEFSHLPFFERITDNTAQVSSRNHDTEGKRRLRLLRTLLLRGRQLIRKNPTPKLKLGKTSWAQFADSFLCPMFQQQALLKKSC